jgi:hypothetical protein
MCEQGFDDNRVFFKRFAHALNIVKGGASIRVGLISRFDAGHAGLVGNVFCIMRH